MCRKKGENRNALELLHQDTTDTCALNYGQTACERRIQPGHRNLKCKTCNASFCSKCLPGARTPQVGDIVTGVYNVGGCLTGAPGTKYGLGIVTKKHEHEVRSGT
jgi:hypothetical protein